MVTKSKLTYTFTFQLVIHVVQKCYDGEQETPWEQLQAFLHICLYALKAWNMFSCLFQTESVENFLLAFLGFSRFLQNQESLDSPVFPGIFPGFSACAKKGWKPRNVIPEFCRIPGSFSSREDKKMKLPFKMMWALFFPFPVNLLLFCIEGTS